MEREPEESSRRLLSKQSSINRPGYEDREICRNSANPEDILGAGRSSTNIVVNLIMNLIMIFCAAFMSGRRHWAVASLLYMHCWTTEVAKPRKKFNTIFRFSHNVSITKRKFKPEWQSADYLKGYCSSRWIWAKAVVRSIFLTRFSVRRWSPRRMVIREDEVIN